MSHPDKRRTPDAENLLPQEMNAEPGSPVQAGDAHDASLSATTSLDDLFKAILGGDASSDNPSERAAAPKDAALLASVVPPLAAPVVNLPTAFTTLRPEPSHTRQPQPNGSDPSARQ